MARPSQYTEQFRKDAVALVRSSDSPLRQTADLALALCEPLFAMGNRFDAWERTHHAALAAVPRSANSGAEAALMSELGRLRYEQDRYAEARTCYLQALTTFRDTGKTHSEAATLTAMGTTCREQGYLPEALHFLTQACAIFVARNDHVAVASTDRVSASVRLELARMTMALRSSAPRVATKLSSGSSARRSRPVRTTGSLG